MSEEPQVADLILSLGLVPHPEGGYYAEVHRSALEVTPADGRPARSALTTIYFLLPAGSVSRWHRLSSDEVWHFYGGAPLELFVADGAFDAVDVALLGAHGGGARSMRVVAAGFWQAARSTGSYSLVGCTVGPGFDFSDFELLGGNEAAVALVKQRQPEFAAFV